MAFLAALALAGFIAAASLARHWQEGAGANLTVQVPNPADAAPGGGTRRERALALLRAAPGVAEANVLSDDQLADLLRPWLGSSTEALAVPLPAVIRVRLSMSAMEPNTEAARAARLDALDRNLRAAIPGTLVESHQIWIGRLATLARSLQAIAGVVVLVVAGVAAAVVAVATRAGLSARREAIEIVHGLGATGGYIAGRFARRATWLAAVGGLAGALTALPVLVGLTGWRRFMRIVGLRDVMDEHHPMQTPHDYLLFLGVTPEAQGHGVGSRLIKSHLARLDAIGRPAFLETATEPNVRLYSRHGFKVLSEWRPAPDGPVNWSMWREPQAPE